MNTQENEKPGADLFQEFFEFGQWEHMFRYWSGINELFFSFSNNLQEHRALFLENMFKQEAGTSPLRMDAAFDYWTDAVQRSILFVDILRNRGNTFLDHLEKGQPPVLTFDYEIIMDGRTLDRGANYALVRILPENESDVNPRRRPIVIIDPRAGHGPGIGGSKQDSEIGMAMGAGHPVYFIMFYPDPVQGQTLADVQRVQTMFVEEIARRHPDTQEPAVIGNCQAGWAAALLTANRPDVTGPLVLIGSPLSYWSGEQGKNPMRFRGGVFGGVWITSFFSDLGNGQFDGAHLVSNFEDLNPANTYWLKPYSVYSNVDKEASRFLNFEKWWNGYFTMTAEEIHFIVNNLFMGNKLEHGMLEVNEGTQVDLKVIREPVMVFASSGDNITPPMQALNWIARVYGSVDEIKYKQQVIVYLLHDNIGHLGIFVSGKVARKEHREIIGSIDMVQFLPPGLYEMIIEEDGSADPEVRFEQRELEDILALGGDPMEEDSYFRPAGAVSDLNGNFYNAFVSPYVRAFTNDFSAEILRWLHPLRVSRYFFSDLNPMVHPFKLIAPIARENRRPVSEGNPFTAFEKLFSDRITATLDLGREVRDRTYEFIYKSVYGHPLLKLTWSDWGKKEVRGIRKEERRASTEPWSRYEKRQNERRSAADRRSQQAHWMERGNRNSDREYDRQYRLEMTDKGGFPEAVVRILLAMAGANREISRKQFDIFKTVMATHERLKSVSSSDLMAMIKEQSRILDVDEEHALGSLAKLLPVPDDLSEALDIARTVLASGGNTNGSDNENKFLEEVEKICSLGW